MGMHFLRVIPGLGKTQLIYTLSEALDLSFKRIQFTPDMMPSDITGTTLLVEDEHGRKTSLNFNRDLFSLNSSSLTRLTAPHRELNLHSLEAMQERTVTVGRTSPHVGRAFLRACHTEPVGNGRHLSAPGGATRPIPIQAPDRLSG